MEYKIKTEYTCVIKHLRFDTLEGAAFALRTSYPESLVDRGWYIVDDDANYYVYNTEHGKWQTMKEWVQYDDDRIRRHNMAARVRAAIAVDWLINRAPFAMLLGVYDQWFEWLLYCDEELSLYDFLEDELYRADSGEISNSWIISELNRIAAYRSQRTQEQRDYWSDFADDLLARIKA